MQRLCRAGSTTAPAQTAIDGAPGLMNLMPRNARAANLRRVQAPKRLENIKNRSKYRGLKYHLMQFPLGHHAIE